MIALIQTKNIMNNNLKTKTKHTAALLLMLALLAPLAARAQSSFSGGSGNQNYSIHNNLRFSAPTGALKIERLKIKIKKALRQSRKAHIHSFEAIDFRGG